MVRGHTQTIREIFPESFPNIFGKSESFPANFGKNYVNKKRSIFKVEKGNNYLKNAVKK